ncbi:MAG: hypothetical protein ACRCYU_09640 [Nocardioides sp.]
MTAALLLAWIAALYRLWISLRGPHTLWRWSFTLALMCVATGLTALVYATEVNDVLGPNSSTLISHILTLIAGGLVAIYLLTLTRVQVDRRWTAGIGVCTTALVAVQVWTWREAPIHQQSYADLTPIPGTEWYSLSYYLSLGVLLALTAYLCARFASRPAAGDHSRVVGLACIAIGTGAASLIVGMYAARTLMKMSAGTDIEQLRTAGDFLAPGALGAIAAGTLTFLVGPSIQRRRDDAQLLRDIMPLWQRLHREQPAPPRRHHRIGPHVDRAIIEIHDALRTLRVTPGDDPFAAIVRALNGDNPAPTVDASDLLPITTTVLEDRAVIRQLARTYHNASHAS